MFGFASKLNFSNQHSYDRHVAEVTAREREEAARRAAQRAEETANAEAEQRAADDLPATSGFDWLGLASIDDHPFVVESQARLTDAKRAAENVTASIEDARAELARVEEAAAYGQRDDSAIRTAQARIDALGSEERIAAAGVRHAERDVADTWRAVAFAANANLRAMHAPLVEEFDAALQQARALSRHVADIENAHRRLIQSGAYTPKNRKTARPIRPLAWRKEFGPGGFYDHWRKCGLRLPPLD